MLLATDGNAQANSQQGLGREENLQLHQVTKAHANLAGDGDHHAAQKPGEYATLPAKFPRHHHIGQKDHDQQQTFNFR